MGKLSRILILGGTTEARRLAERLAPRADLDVRLSLAGRTSNPVPHPVPVRVGGFGGAEGLAQYLESERIDRLIDATHPYAAQMSAHAAQAARRAGVPLLALRRPAWQPVAGDRWSEVADTREAARVLGEVRKAKSEQKRSMRAPVDRVAVRDDAATVECLRLVADDLREAGGITELALEPVDASAAAGVAVELAAAD